MNGAFSSADALAETDERSIFIRSGGNSRSCESDEYPVPKSSIAIRTPSARSASIVEHADAESG